MKWNRVGYVALVDLWGNRGDAGKGPFNAEAYEPSRHYLSHLLEEGQKSGELRPLAVRPTASLIQAAIDGIMLQWVFDENAIDLDQARDDVMEMVTRHVSQGETR
jgi:hypothetical protein